MEHPAVSNRDQIKSQPLGAPGHLAQNLGNLYVLSQSPRQRHSGHRAAALEEEGFGETDGIGDRGRHGREHRAGFPFSTRGCDMLGVDLF